jgi:hypothetical protein
MRFSFGNVHYDGPVGNRWEVLLRVVGDFFIYASQSLLYSEVEFCLVEFSVQLAQWLGRLGPHAPDFAYTSMESDVEGLVRIVRTGPDQWRVSAAHQAYDEQRTFSTAEIQRAAVDFICELRAALKDRLDVFDYLDERGRAAVLAGPN